MQYRFIDQNDVSILAALRLEYLQETTSNPLPLEILPNTIMYLEDELNTGALSGVVAVLGERIVAVGLLSVFSVMPTRNNITGKRGYLFNFYIRPEYRRQGIATTILDKLKDEARRQGVCDLFLNAREMTIPLYEKAGFTFLQREMQVRIYF